MLENTGELELLSAVPFSWQQQQWKQMLRQFQQQRLAHCFLVCGESGLGKSEFVTMLARYMLCQQPLADSACGNCKSCLLAQNNSHPDFYVLAAEAGSKEIKIDQIRALTSFVHRSSHAGTAKIAVLNHAHRLNNNSANALLKTLEEPSPNTYLFLVTDLPGRLKPTIRSRCQRLQFTAPTTASCKDCLFEILGVEVPAEVLSAAGNRPMRALDLIASGAVAQRQEFIKTLTDLSRRRVSILATVNLASKFGDIAAIEYLLWISSILIKCILCAQAPPASEQAVGQLWSLFAAAKSPGRDQAMALLNYQQEVSMARNQLMSASNPNSQLILESLLWQWSELCRQLLASVRL